MDRLHPVHRAAGTPSIQYDGGHGSPPACVLSQDLELRGNATQVHLISSLGALQQAVNSSQAAINTLRPSGLAELASSHVLKQAEVTPPWNGI